MGGKKSAGPGGKLKAGGRGDAYTAKIAANRNNNNNNSSNNGSGTLGKNRRTNKYEAQMPPEPIRQFPDTGFSVQHLAASVQKQAQAQAQQPVATSSNPGDYLREEKGVTGESGMVSGTHFAHGFSYVPSVSSTAHGPVGNPFSISEHTALRPAPYNW